MAPVEGVAARAVWWAERAAGLPERLLLRALSLQPRHPPTFVVGVPRSGTTLTTLVLARSCRWSYIPERSNRHPELCLALALMTRLANRQPPDSYANEYGKARGAAGPSDGWELFHRWFPRYDLDRPVRAERLGDLVTLVRLLEIVFGAPFLLKNNNTATRIPVLRSLFPDALWVHVHRDELATAESLLRARRHFGVGLDEWWSAAPPAYWNRSFGDEFDQVAHTVVGVEEAIVDGLESVPPEQRVQISYEALCREPAQLVRGVRERYDGFGHPLAYFCPPPASFAVDAPKHDAADRQRLAEALHRVSRTRG